jgi:hypothetical protein
MLIASELAAAVSSAQSGGAKPNAALARFTALQAAGQADD